MYLYLFRVFVLLMPFISSAAGAQVFTADMANSEWVAASNPSICTLTHNIPGFGKAVFTHKAGGGASVESTLFYLETNGKIVFPVGATTIETLPPAWRTNVVPISLGDAVATAGTQPIKLTTSQTSSLLTQLVNGIKIVFTSHTLGTPPGSNSSKGSANVMRVIIEAKNFAPAYKTYQQCTGEYKAHVNTNSSSVSTVAGVNTSRDVSRVVSYIKRDAQVYGTTYINKNPKSVGAQTFETDIASADWKTGSSPFACNLTHNITGFGKAVFSHKAGNEETFYLEPQDKITFPAGVTNLETLPPIWRNDLAHVSLAKITAVAGAQPVTLSSAQITQLVAQLTGGTNVMFTSQSTTDDSNFALSATGSDVVRVVLNAKKFVAAHKNYEQCVDQLIPYSFAQVARTLINYPEKSESLSASAKIELAKVVRYVKADTSVLGVLVDGHSDDSGTSETNESKAKKEAELVSAYLIEQGIAAEKITVRGHGSKYPIATNKTPEGRAKNRRVTVRLDTESTRREIEKKIAEIKAAADKEEAEKAAHQISSTKINLAEQHKSGSITGDTKTPEKTGEKPENGASASSRGKMTPEEIRKLVEGLDLIDGK